MVGNGRAHPFLFGNEEAQGLAQDLWFQGIRGVTVPMREA